MRVTSVVAVLGALAASGVPAWADDAPRVREEAGIRYVIGGVGEDERAAIEAMRKDFNLELVFAAKEGGSYVAEVEVAISDASGKPVLSTNAEAPILLAQLPPGRYTVKATFNGETQTRRVTIGKGARGVARTALYWHDPTVGETASTPPERESSSRGGR